MLQSTLTTSAQRSSGSGSLVTSTAGAAASTGAQAAHPSIHATIPLRKSKDRPRRLPKARPVDTRRRSSS